MYIDSNYEVFFEDNVYSLLVEFEDKLDNLSIHKGQTLRYPPVLSDDPIRVLSREEIEAEEN